MLSDITDDDVFLRFSEDKPFSLRDGRAIYPHQLSDDLSRASRLIPSGRGDVLVTCKGRYEFSVALLSAWLAGKNVILSPNLHHASLERIRQKHAIIVELKDGLIAAKDAPLSHYEQKGNPEQTFVELHLQKKQQALTIYTSGSSGEPKAVQKSIGDIFAEAFALKKSLPWPDMPLVASVPPHHLYGLSFSILLPWVLGVPMIDACPLHASEVVETLKQVDAGILITVPVHLRAMLEQQVDCKPVMTISSAGALSADIARMWQARFDREVIEIYGSSETGIIAHRQQMSNTLWGPFPSVQVATNSAGLLQVRSPFINASEGGFFQTQDMVTMQQDSAFQLHGRADSIVKIAGKRVSLLTVEEAVKRCDGVLDAAVIAVPVQGYIRDVALWAAVAIGDALDVTAGSIRAQLLSMLDGIKVPRRIVVLNKLPRESNGKLRRERLMALFQDDRKV